MQLVVSCFQMAEINSAQPRQFGRAKTSEILFVFTLLQYTIICNLAEYVHAHFS